MGKFWRRHGYCGFQKKLIENALTDDIHWLRPDLAMKAGDSRQYSVRIRYRQPLQSARLSQTEDGIHIIFEQPQRGVTPGQFAVWYDGEEVIGSGVIS